MYKKFLNRNVVVVVSKKAGAVDILKYSGILSEEDAENVLLCNCSVSFFRGGKLLKDLNKVIINKDYIISCYSID